MRYTREVPDLVMSAKRAVWRMNDHGGEGADKEFQRLRHTILDACGGRCEFCGLISAKYQEVHHADDNHRNNKPENLFGSCPLCHQVFHIGLAGMKDGAWVIYAPEFTQAEINQISLLIWTVEATKDSGVISDPLFLRIRDKAVKLRGDLENRRGTVLLRMEAYLKQNNLLPEGMKVKLSHYSPSLFANVLMSLDDETFAKRKDLLGGLRLLPRAARFEDRIEHWRDEQARIMAITDWPSLVPESQLRQIILNCVERVQAAEQLIANTG
jgi:intracellular multiplication protein IcmJ